MTADPDAPPFRPDPEIIGNIEGNDKIRKHDRTSARHDLDDRGLIAPADDQPEDEGRSAQ